MANNFGEIAASVVPGVSWTAAPKSRPWLRPPSEVDVGTLAQQYMAVLAAPQVANDILDALETELPIATIAESLMLSGVNKGLHTVDAGVLVMPVIMETLKTIADMNDIKTVMFPSDIDDGTIHPRVKRKLLESIKTIEAEAPMEEAAAEEKPMMTGLMSRKKEGV